VDREVIHVRDAGQRDFHETGIEVLLQTRGAEHHDALLASLAEHGYEVVTLAFERGIGSDAELREDSTMSAVRP